MQVIKRNGKRESVKFDKITARIERLSYSLSNRVDPAAVALRVIEGIYDGVTTTELDTLASEIAASMTARHPDYAILASRIAVSNLHKNTVKCFSETVRILYEFRDPITGRNTPLISDEIMSIVQNNSDMLDSSIVYERDFNFDFFGFKTLERSYLLRVNGRVVERPQHLYMRVAVGIHGEDIASAIETYHTMSEKWFIHATPTLFNAGTPRPQMSSCFVMPVKDDSIDGIFETIKDIAKISQSAGGIGVALHKVRATGSYISGTNGTSNGIIPMLKVFNDTARYVDQGGGKRKGAVAVYLEPWHADIEAFLDLKKNHGKEELRARDLFYALWIPDLFMKRIEANEAWSLFSPDEAQGLHECWGDEFEELYTDYERQGKARKQIPAQELWFSIIESQIETGTPFLLYKDAANRKSNHKHLGTIQCSNLCTEIMEYTSPEETGVCNLASIALPRFVKNEGEFDFEHLYKITYQITENLNKVIDRNFYPLPSAEKSNRMHRPIGIGVQGLADTFFLMHLPFESNVAAQLNRDIFETIYYAAMTASKELAIKYGAYESFKGSPLSQGEFQFDLWNVTPSDRYDWNELRSEVIKHGVRNSLLLAPMPTASTSQILGYNECFEPYTSNIYVRRVLSGEFMVVNKYLLKDLVERNIWSEEMKDRIIQDNGSVQNIPEIPEDLRELYKTVWEIKQRTLIDMAADRGAFICQSQSLNLFMDNPSHSKLTSMHFHAWKKGLKTGIYYLRTQAAHRAVQFTVKKSDTATISENAPHGDTCRREEDCLVCGS